jgi:effector-binding domain-containing protein
MQVDFNRELKYSTVVTIRKKILQEAIPDELVNIERFIDDAGLKKRGPVITTVSALDYENGAQLIELEIVIPVDRRFTPRQGYEFREDFRIPNAVCVRFRDRPERLQLAYQAAQTAMRDKGLKPVGSFYNVYVEHEIGGRIRENVDIDVYLPVEREE